MATLGVITDFDTDDDELGNAVAQHNIALTWQWRTWPANLRHAFIGTLLLLLFILAIVVCCIWYNGLLSEKLLSENALKTQAQTLLQNSGRERSDIENNLPLLRQLEASGIFGEEKRLEWIEQIRITEKRWPGVTIRFDIAAQTLQNTPTTSPSSTTVTAPPAGSAMMNMAMTMESQTKPPTTEVKGFGVFQTKMKLSLKLLHEGDALAILDELKQAKLGRFDVNECSFRRPIEPLAVQQSNPIDADCQLTWISMKSYKP